jgi:FixJ family two-component response regulator
VIVREQNLTMAKSEPRTEPPLVVVVDDDASFRRAVGRLIGLWGFRTFSFGSAEEYLGTGVETDCIVLDVHLEGMSGLELQAVLAAQKKSIPIIFVTAMDDADARRSALAAGAAAFLEKPFDDYSLLEVLKAVTSYPST